MEDERNSKEIYDKHIETRSQYVDRAEEIAALTIPYLLTKKGYSGSSSQESSIKQSDMASNINSLTSKIVMTLFPTASSSFRLAPDRDAMAQLVAQGGEGMKQEVSMSLSNETARINKEMEAQDIRPSAFAFIREAMVTGSIIIEKVKDKGVKYHNIDSIGCLLDASGEPYEMSIKEVLTRLPDGITVEEESDEYELYTSVVMDKESSKWIMKQSIGTESIGEEKTFNDENLPFQYFGWSIGKGDTYHRPYTEQQIGDIRSLNILSKVLTDGSVIASKSLIFVDPRGGRTRMRDVSNSANGDIIEGRADDVTSFQLQKNYDFQVPMTRLAELKASLERSYLVNQSASRQAERVTATEVQFMAQELETQLAGIYSVMASKISKRIVTWIMKELKIDFGAVNVDIIVGLDSLSKQQEAQKMDAFMQTLTALGYNNAVKQSEVVGRYADFYGINTTDLIKTDEEISQEQQAAQQQASAQQGEEAFAQSTGKGAGEALIQPPGQQQQQQEGQ